MAKHELKTWPDFYDAVERGDKVFEVRKNDRFFQKGDEVVLVKWPERHGDPMRQENILIWCGAPRLRFRIGDILQGGQFGIEPGYCVFSLLPLIEAAKES